MISVGHLPTVIPVGHLPNKIKQTMKHCVHTCIHTHIKLVVEPWHRNGPRMVNSHKSKLTASKIRIKIIQVECLISHQVPLDITRGYYNAVYLRLRSSTSTVNKMKSVR